MLSPLWWFPLAVAAAAAIPLWRGARSLEVRAAELRTAVADLGRVRPLLVEVKAELAAVEAARLVSRNVHDEAPR
jgi:hypothetical protein